MLVAAIRPFIKQNPSIYSGCSLHGRNCYCAGDSKSIKVKTRGIDTLQFGHEEVDLSAVEQLFDTSQTRAIGEALLILMDWSIKPQWRGKSLAELLAALDRDIETKVDFKD